MSVVTDNAVSAKKAAKFKFVFITTLGSLFFRRKIRKWKKKLSEQFPKIFQPLHTNLHLKKGKRFYKKLLYHNVNIAINRKKSHNSHLIFLKKLKTCSNLLRNDFQSVISV